MTFWTRLNVLQKLIMYEKTQVLLVLPLKTPSILFISNMNCRRASIVVSRRVSRRCPGYLFLNENIEKSLNAYLCLNFCHQQSKYIRKNWAVAIELYSFWEKRLYIQSEIFRHNQTKIFQFKDCRFYGGKKIQILNYKHCIKSFLNSKDER